MYLQTMQADQRLQFARQMEAGQVQDGQDAFVSAVKEQMLATGCTYDQGVETVRFARRDLAESYVVSVMLRGGHLRAAGLL